MDNDPEVDEAELSVAVDDPEVPEADSLEQAAVVEPRQLLDPVSLDPEVPEADALEQAEVVIGPEPGESI